MGRRVGSSTQGDLGEGREEVEDIPRLAQGEDSGEDCVWNGHPTGNARRTWFGHSTRRRPRWKEAHERKHIGEGRWTQDIERNENEPSERQGDNGKGKGHGYEVLWLGRGRHCVSRLHRKEARWWFKRRHRHCHIEEVPGGENRNFLSGRVVRRRRGIRRDQWT